MIGAKLEKVQLDTSWTHSEGPDRNLQMHFFFRFFAPFLSSHILHPPDFYSSRINGFWKVYRVFNFCKKASAFMSVILSDSLAVGSQY